MPVLSARTLASRNAGTGRDFAIIFTIVAFAIISACLWGFCLPKWRAKHPPRPSSTRFNCIGGAAMYATPPKPPLRFPSHPAVMRGIHKKPSRDLRVYDPRTESPFPNSPHTGESVRLSSVNTNRTKPLFRIEWSNLKTQAPNDEKPDKHPELGSDLVEGDQGFWRHDDVDQSELALPEQPPPVARAAGRAPPLTKQLARFPMPSSTSTRSFDSLRPPKQQSEKLEYIEFPPKTFQSTRIPLHLPSKGSCQTATYEPVAPVSVFLEPISYGETRKSTITGELGPSSQGLRNTVNYATNAAAGVTTKQRYKDSVFVCSGGPKDDGNLSGSFSKARKSKPKPSIAEIRGRYDRNIGRPKFMPPSDLSLCKVFIPSTEPLTTSASATSDLRSPTTPPTSLPTPTNPSALLSTSLRQDRAANRSSSSPTPHQTRIHANPPIQIPIRKSSSKLNPTSTSKNPKCSGDDGRSFDVDHPGMTSSKHGLKLYTAFNNTEKSNDDHSSVLGRDGMSATSKMTTTPLLRAQRPFSTCWNGSSIYSRDTKGMSVLRSPVFSEETAQETERKLPLGEPSRRRSSSTDLARTKIDDWILYTADLDLPSSPTTTNKLTLSDFGPQSPTLFGINDSPAPLNPHAGGNNPTTFGLTVPVPKVYVGRASDDVFGDEKDVHGRGRVLKQVLDMEMANSSGDLFRYNGKTAPGGAEWI